MRRAAALVLVACLALAACGGGDDDQHADRSTTTDTAETTATTAPASTVPIPADDPLGGFQPDPLDWDDCGGGMECATLTVPLDWSDLDGDTIDLAVARVPADGDSEGALVSNPGGPGASGIDFIEGGGPFAGTDLADRFDLVSWDPRGVGQSAGLDCGEDEAADFVRLDPEPDTPDEQVALDEGAKAVADDCGREAGDELAHVGTDDTASDLEALRRALGEPLLYYGFSYGTFIGLRYAELFPDGARAIVLDGVVDPTDSLPDLLRAQTVAFDNVVADVFADCPAGHQGCPEGGDAAAYDRVAAATETGSIPDGQGGTLTPADLATATVLSSYDRSFWPILHQALADADGGDGSGILQLADAYRGASAYAPYQAISCLDSPHPEGADAWAAFAEELAGLSPRFGASIANEMLPCAFWPVPPDPVNGPVKAEGSPPILVIGTTGDPATPVEQAERVAAGLADGHLLVFDGEGHTAFGSSACVEDAVTAYLVDGTLPDDGARC